jgi:hypothetical protein
MWRHILLAFCRVPLFRGVGLVICFRWYEVSHMSTCLRTLAFKTLGVLSAAGVMMLTGCGAGIIAGPSATSGFKINGNVHGGPFPIQGATIRLMETQSNGVWNTATGSYKGQAKQLLRTTSDSLGNFTFPDTGWTCDANQYAYIEVEGGHTTALTNNNVIQIGVIGGCSDTLANQTEIDNVNVYISELSTVAAAYALGDFMYIGGVGSTSADPQSDPQIVNITAPAANNAVNPGCTGSGSTGATALSCKHAGLAHAFANAYNLVDSVTYGAGQFPSGAARTVIPGNKQSAVPQARCPTSPPTSPERRAPRTAVICSTGPRRPAAPPRPTRCRWPSTWPATRPET